MIDTTKPRCWTVFFSNRNDGADNENHHILHNIRMDSQFNDKKESYFDEFNSVYINWRNVTHVRPRNCGCCSPCQKTVDKGAPIKEPK